MVRTSLVSVLMVLMSVSLHAQVHRYVVFFKDKTGTPYSINAPQEFLTQRALDRRTRQNIQILAEDLPVTPSYVQQLREAGLKVLYQTRWMNGVMMEGTAAQAQAVSALPFVQAIEYLAPGERPVINGRIKSEDEVNAGNTVAGATDTQLSLIGIDKMHLEGYRGEGMLIAIMDAGFPNANTISYFQHIFNEGRFHEAGSYDFVAGRNTVFSQHQHGTNVWSIMAGFEEGSFVGGAYKASYVLFVTEHSPTEYRVEEYNWLLAAERADSLGVDVINTSLGYSTFDDPTMNYTTSQMDGQTTVITRASAIAARKGMAVVTSAGNEGGTECTWCIITAPADGKNVLAVGAVTSSGSLSSFSSIGPSSDGRIKPDVAAMGTGVSIVRSDGTIVTGNGTSFAGPLLASLVAGYWQKYPELSVPILFDSIRGKSSQAASPDFYKGYGIPDFNRPFTVITDTEQETKDHIHIYPNPCANSLQIELPDPKSSIQLVTLQGRELAVQATQSDNSIRLDMSQLPQGFYLLIVRTGAQQAVYKILKGTE